MPTWLQTLLAAILPGIIQWIEGELNNLEAPAAQKASAQIAQAHGLLQTKLASFVRPTTAK